VNAWGDGSSSSSSSTVGTAHCLCPTALPGTHRPAYGLLQLRNALPQQLAADPVGWCSAACAQQAMQGPAAVAMLQTPASQPGSPDHHAQCSHPLQAYWPLLTCLALHHPQHITPPASIPPAPLIRQSSFPPQCTSCKHTAALATREHIQQTMQGCVFFRCTLYTICMLSYHQTIIINNHQVTQPPHWSAPHRCGW
jgi:hypothetical protein